MRTWSESTVASPEVAWSLLARPGEWASWAPHVRGAWGLGEPEVRQGALGAALLLGVVPVPARIVDVAPGRSWTWRVGLGAVEMVHRVVPEPGGGSTVAIDLIAPGPLEAVLATTYGPVIGFTLRRLAARAAGRQSSSGQRP